MRFKIIFLVICLSVSGIGSAVAQSNEEYDHLKSLIIKRDFVSLETYLNNGATEIQ